jgi:hypothetical protein
MPEKVALKEALVAAAAMMDAGSEAPAQPDTQA